MLRLCFLDLQLHHSNPRSPQPALSTFQLYPCIFLDLPLPLLADWALLSPFSLLSPHLKGPGLFQEILTMVTMKKIKLTLLKREWEEKIEKKEVGSMEKDIEKSSCRKKNTWEKYGSWKENGVREENISLDCFKEDNSSKIEFLFVQCLRSEDDDGEFETIIIRLMLMNKLVTMYEILAGIYSTKWLPLYNEKLKSKIGTVWHNRRIKRVPK